MREEFLARVYQLDRSDTDRLSELATWLWHEAIGGDLEDPIVQLGYELDHLLDFESMDRAVEELRRVLPSFTEDVQAFVAAARAEIEGS